MRVAGCGRLLSLGLWVVMACNSGGDAPSAAPPATTAPSVAPPTVPSQPVPFDAAATFRTTCGSCHGEGGDGNGPASAALTPKPANFADAAFWEGKDRAHIVKVIKEGGPSVGKSPLMVAWGGQFNDEQIGALADIVMGFKQ